MYWSPRRESGWGILARHFSAASVFWLAALVEKPRIDGLGRGDIAQQIFEVALHGDPCARGIVSLDCVQNGLMLGDHARDSSLLRQRQPAIAIDVHLDLLDQRPDDRISRDFRDGCVKLL